MMAVFSTILIAVVVYGMPVGGDIFKGIHIALLLIAMLFRDSHSMTTSLLLLVLSSAGLHTPTTSIADLLQFGVFLVG